jgi:uncharacterized protein (TIGR01777 family)
MNAFFTILSVQIVLGALDNFWHHEITERLPAQRRARWELSLHAVREALYAILFVGLAHWAWLGAWSWLIALLLAVEIAVTMTDFVVEDMTRRLPKLERILHTVLALNYGAALAVFTPVLLAWQSAPSAVAAVDHGVWSTFLTAAGVGVGGWAVRDAWAAMRHFRLPTWQRVRLVPGRKADPRAVLITGATGFIGTALTHRLIERGERVVVLTRDHGRALDRFGPYAEIVTSLAALPSDARIDAVVSLAGASIAARRWSNRRKRELVESRRAVTEGLLRLVARLEQKPTTWINASAVGYYGVRNDDAALDEKSPTQQRFQAELCSAWERHASSAARDGVKVTLLRFGLVLGRSGGILPALARPVRLGLGVVLGTGRQWVSWIHVDDAVGLIEFVLDERVLAGPLNATAPTPLRHAELMRLLARQLGRRLLPLRVPAPIVRGLLGELAELIVDGQQAVPARACALAFRFRYPTPSAALRDLLVSRGAVGGAPREVKARHGFF